ncbi:MAG: ABC transporter permease [Lachnospiraceae bacterium]|nr:ABC transporter permease [Lachnospiraceae bacterium]
MYKKFIHDIKKYFNYAFVSAKSELKSEVANSHLSWLWWILDPLLFMLVYTFISIIVFKQKIQYFPIFVFIGLSCWQFFEKTVKQSVKIVSKNSHIVKKVYIPKYTLIFVKLMANGFKMLVSFSLVIILMLIYRVQLSFHIFYIFPLLLTLIVITFAVSSIMLHFGVYVEDLANVVNVFLRLVFYMSGIFYSIKGKLPEPYITVLLKCNPVALIIDDMRECMLYCNMPHRKLMLLWLVVGLVISAVGIRTIYKNENSYVKVI